MISVRELNEAIAVTSRGRIADRVSRFDSDSLNECPPRRPTTYWRWKGAIFYFEEGRDLRKNTLAALRLAGMLLRKS